MPAPLGSKPTITITTEIRSRALAGEPTSRWVAICIADNGPGITIEDQTRILESFSVEKRAEKETSLAVSYQIITAKHGGTFKLRSRHTAAGTPHSRIEGMIGNNAVAALTEQNFVIGTEFELLLPLV